MRKAIIAMSGGVDSSVAALLTKETGDECIGATMKLFHNEDIGVKREKTCCSLDDVEDARNVCYRMGIRYYVFNFSERFKEDVMDRFVDAYEHGATPNPCIDCNRYLKFDKMFQRIRELEYDYIVTGHYARVEYDEKRDRYLLKKAVDDTKDQSYVLYMLTQEQLAQRLGNLPVEVRSGKEGLLAAATMEEADTVITAVVGMVGLEPTLAAIQRGKRIGLVYYQWLSGHLFGMNPCRISKPVMRMNHIARIGSGNHSGNNRIIIDFFQQVIRISTRKLYTSQIIKMHIIEICINMIPQIKVFLRIHISS